MDQAWEEKLKRWSKPPSDTEETRCENAVSAIKKAINASDKLKTRDIKVFPQGSYRNNTNVRLDSDVDVGIVCFDSIISTYPEGMGRSDFGLVQADYTYKQFKNDVGQALIDYFGASAVTRGNKAFDVHENSYHVEADVAPFFEHRRYHNDGTYISGVALHPDNGIPGKVINWPDEHYENGVGKNNDTGKRYKSLVRIMKALRNEMKEQGTAEALPVIGFLNECLVWNVPNHLFGNTFYYDDLREVIVHLYNNTKTDSACSEWGEVSELKYLFKGHQKWTRQQVNSFTLAAWRHVGFQ